MIDNPLENQVMKEYDSSYINEKYEEHCADRAKELAEINNLLPDYYEPFIEFYNDFADYFTELCKESDEGYSLINEKSIIDDWWDHNKDLYETKTPYMEIKNDG